MNRGMEFCRHELEWTPEKIARFWDFESQNEAKRGEYFTRQVGDALVRLTCQNRAMSEPVLDYGSGAGHLTMRLAQAGIRCSACDYSPASVEELNRNLAGNVFFSGCEWLRELPSAMAGGSFGTAFLVETMEHLLPEWRVHTLQEVWRLLRPGGYIVVTVPFSENLGAAKVICADCGAVFHRVQHVASFDVRSLASAMSAQGFEEVLCRPMALALLTDELQRPARRFRRWLRRQLVGWHVLPPRREPTPNLVYIGRKPAG